MGGGECDVVRLWGGIKLPLVGFGTATFPYNGERISQAIGIALEVRWDGTSSVPLPKRVSPWKIEPALTLPVRLSPSQIPTAKRPCGSVVPSLGSSVITGEALLSDLFAHAPFCNIVASSLSTTDRDERQERNTSNFNFPVAATNALSIDAYSPSIDYSEVFNSFDNVQVFSIFFNEIFTTKKASYGIRCVF
ncbi:hypothetical protein MRB53_028829 [Persea americana]|uniref:Uncharacterized protein n=1 Tax=Persea americana TaxID=3435 RepID=A0ACC2KGM5_PERAE|nr:hypothetical protein MRB53_028829 [Persea americana]